MTFVFQQPGSAGLLDTLNDCSKDAEGGGGIFAFASKGGVEAIFALPNIEAMLKTGRPFHLIVGIDALTNTEALLCLGEKVAKHKKSLKAHVFFHDQAPSTFHPKFSWFCKQGGISLITGSGNLTERGLGKQPKGQAANWEAFSVQSLNGKDAGAAEMEINGWLEAQAAAGTLCSLNDARVLEKAMANARVRYTNGGMAAAKPKAKLEPQPQAMAVAGVEANPDTLEVLIRELPKTRGGQGDVGQTAHNKFFGHEGKDKDIFMQYVDLNDTLHHVKKVWLFYNDASNNYRLELPESKENYEIGDKDERMILVAVKLDQRSFRYTILRPKANQQDYDKVSTLFGPVKKAGRRLMRERFASADDLRGAWDHAPSNLLPLRLPTPEP
jgi:hypothetical protein